MATPSYDKPTGEVKAHDASGMGRAHHMIAAWVDAEVFLHLVYYRGVAVND
ncbi:hypothetical protein OVER9000_32 [Escherichia phage vB_EcoD_Over9000]|uniref:Uncharacterized protein n=1 Tax=Escherichia phage vB_EcoD_Over9000 TaxID=2894795 RepID=A0AAE8YTX7_9CAUD|nr:hypothetical protein P9626_gp32 [Escherichia phage vB_EcoD_Over9000]UGO49871.1 hypothetical protein OVER9000_32 [Escherichia phage vB_EcoD_Over9000]